MTCGSSTPTPAIQVNNISVTEGQKAVFTVALNASNTATTVNLSLLNGTATVGTANTNDVSSAMEYYNGSRWVPVINNIVTIPGSSNSRNFQVRMQTIDNTIYEGREQFSLRAIANNVTATGIATINDNDAAPIVQSVSSITVTEGQQAVFTIDLAGVSSIATNVQLNVAAGTAGIGTDVSSAMEVSFFNGTTWSGWTSVNNNNVSAAAGVQKLQVRVQTIDNTAVEGTETFKLTAKTSCANTVSGIGTILDNDVAPPVSSGFAISSITNASVIEGQQAVFTINLVNPAVVNSSYGFDTEDDDYDYGTSSQDGYGTSSQDGYGNSTNGGDDYGTSSHGDDDYGTGSHGGSTTPTMRTVDLLLTNGTTSAADLGGLEYFNGTSWVTAVANKAIVTAGQTSLQVRTLAIVDNIVEGTETFTLKASANGTSKIGNGSISDAAAPVLPKLQPISDATALEGNNVVFTVSLSGASTTATTVDLVLSNGTTSAADLGILEYFNGSNWVAATGNKAIIAAGQTSVQVRTLAVADGVYEGLESFTLKATANGSTQTGNGSITDVAPTLAPIAAATALEGNQVVFTVGLSGASTTATSVDLVLTNGTTSATDLGILEYFNGSNWVVATNNKAIIAAGQTSVQVRTLAVADGVYEGLESFTLKATANGSTQTANGSVTDVAPTLAPIAAATALEGNQVVFTVGLSSASTTATTVDLALSNGTTSAADLGGLEYFNGSNWVAATGNQAVIAAGQTSVQVRTLAVADGVYEGLESFTLKATANGSTQTGNGSVTDVAPTLAPIAAATALEGNQVVFTVGLSGASTTATTVNLTLSNGTTSSADLGGLEYFNGSNWVAATGNQAVIAAGQTSVQVRTLAVADGVYEGLESFTLQASANGSTQTANGSITDIAPTLAPIAAATALEGNQVVFTVGLSGASTTATTVNLALSNGTTSSADLGGLEYFDGSNWVAATGNQAVIAAGQTSVQVRTLAVADGVYEGLESFTLQASANGSTQTANGSVTDVAPTLQPIDAATALEGNNVVFTVGLSGTSTTATTVDLALSNGTTSSADLGGLEYFDGSNWVAATGNQAVIAAGQTSVQVRTLAVADGVYEGLESFTLQASANGSTQTANGSVTDLAPTLAPIAAATALEGNNVVFSVGLSGASTTATTVDLALSNGTTSAADLGGLEYFDGSNWVAATGNQAVIAAGQTSVQVRTLAVADGVYEGLESFTLQASANGSTQTANGSVTDIAPTLQPIDAATALEGNNVVFTVGLSGASTTATTVDLVLTNGTTSSADLGGLEYFDGSNWVAATGNQAIIAAGQTSVQVRTLAVADGVYEGLESFTLQASANGSVQTANGSVNDVAPTLAPIAAATALEGNPVVFTVGLSGTSTTATTVDLALSNGTTSAADLGGLEYFNGSNWVAATGNQAVIAAGQTSVQVRTLAVADGVYEGLESFTLQASANGSTQTGNGSVTDIAPTLQPIAAATALEGNNVVFNVGLSGASTTATTVDLVLTNGTTSGGDLGALEYLSGSNWVAATGNQAVIAAGQTSVQVRTLAVVDGVYEGLESFTLQASANGSTQTANGTVTDLPTTIAPIVGTTGDDNLTGTAGDDSIYGNGGDDTISGGSGNDNLFAGSPTNPNGGFTFMNGDGGNDILTGGNGFNLLNGTNDTLLGVNEYDTLVGGGNGSTNYFYLGSDQGSYYVGGGNTDYASISNFDSNVDFIQLTGTPGDYNVTYTGGIASIYHVGTNGNQDLIAKIDAAPNSLDLNSGYFNYVVQN